MKVIYFGPITQKGQPSGGGYAAANRKNIDKLRELGVDVVEVPKKSNLGLFLQPFKLLKYKNKKDIVVHVATPLGGIFMLPVLLLLRLASIAKIPTLLDIRAGIFIQRYQRYNCFYKYLTRRVLNLSTTTAVEGYAYIRQIQDVIGFKGEIHYFPNIVDCSALNYIEKDCTTINIFYFGRITLSKGIDTMLKIIDKLGNGYHLYLAGPIASDIQKEDLNKVSVTYLGSLTASQLKEQMKKMHFFLFPTRHNGEGQSNSLIEAMSQGLIPITTNQGFCGEVAGSYGKVLPVGSSAEDFVSAIKEIESKGIEIESQKCIEHIKDCHNLDVEIKKIIVVYEKLLEK